LSDPQRNVGVKNGKEKGTQLFLKAQSRAILERHPEGLAHFRHRNFAARSIGRNAEANTDDS
jgi:hypothetical protein